MKIVRKKLASKCGASIVLALVFFLICTVVGGIVLTSAVSNAGRLSHAESEQQAYLTSSSAAQLVRDELQNQEFQAVTTTVDANAPTTVYPSTPSGQILAETVTAWAKYRMGDSLLPSGVLTITATEDSIDDITATFSMDETYAITVIFRLADAEVQYPLTLKIPATAQEDTVTAVNRIVETVNGVETIRYETVITTTLSIQWGTGTITKGGD